MTPADALAPPNPHPPPPHTHTRGAGMQLFVFDDEPEARIKEIITYRQGEIRGGWWVGGWVCGWVSGRAGCLGWAGLCWRRLRSPAHRPLSTPPPTPPPPACRSCQPLPRSMAGTLATAWTRRELRVSVTLGDWRRGAGADTCAHRHTPLASQPATARHQGRRKAAAPHTFHLPLQRELALCELRCGAGFPPLTAPTRVCPHCTTPLRAPP